MSNIVSLKKDFANTIQNTNKRKSHNKYVTSKKSLENSDFKSFLDLYLSNETDFFERIDGYDGFISTQQIESIDYEDFSNHVFFDSAVEKVNYAFDKSINEFPYDSSKYKIDQYLKKLDGFTKYILDNKVEKSLNYLEFNGNTAVVIKDARGSILKDYTGNKILDNFNPSGKSISFDFWIKPKDSSSLTIFNEECILQKHSNSFGFFITLTRNPCKIHFYFEENNNFFK